MRGKGIFILIATCCIATQSCVHQDDRQVSVKGAISHLGNPTLYISYTDVQFNLAFDTIHSSISGKFDFKLHTCDALAPITIRFADKKGWTTLFAEPGDHITISGNIESVDLLSIKGGAVNNDLNRFKNKIGNLYQERLDLLKGSYSTENASEVRLAEINLQLKRTAKEFILDNPSSVASTVLIQDFFYQDYDPNTSDLLSLLTGEASTCRLADKIRSGIQKWH